MSTCPCCSDQLLRHFQKGSLYLFCRSCWAEMPDFENYSSPSLSTAPAKVKPAQIPTRQPLCVVSMPEQPALVKPLGTRVKRNSKGIAA